MFFGSSFPSKVIPFPPSSYTICKAQRRKEEMSLGAAGNDEFIMIAEGVRVSFTSPKCSVGLLLGSAVSEALEEEVLMMLIQSITHSQDERRPYGSSYPTPRKCCDTCCVWNTIKFCIYSI